MEIVADQSCRLAGSPLLPEGVNLEQSGFQRFHPAVGVARLARDYETIVGAEAQQRRCQLRPACPHLPQKALSHVPPIEALKKWYLEHPECASENHVIRRDLTDFESLGISLCRYLTG